MLQAITFDFWGTLYTGASAAPLRAQALQTALAAVGWRGDDATWQGAMGLAWDAADRAWREDRHTLGARHRLRIVEDALGLELPAATFQSLVAAWEEALLQAPPRPVAGVGAALAGLKAAGLPLGLISDTGITPGRVLRQIMSDDGLLHYFAFCAFSDEVGRAKPDPKPFLETLRALGEVDASLAIHIGDLPWTDIDGATAVGMKALLFTGANPAQYSSAKALAAFSRWDDLPATLAGVVGAEVDPALFGPGQAPHV